MSVLLAEPRFSGHLHHVTPLVEPLLARYGSVHVVLPRCARDSPFFPRLAAAADRPGLEISTDAPRARAASELELTPRERRRYERRVGRFLAERVDSLRPGVVVVPTADGIDSHFHRSLDRRARRETRIVLGYHWATARPGLWTRLAARCPALLRGSLLWSAHRHPEIRCLLQDHTVVDEIGKVAPELAARVQLMPFAAEDREPVPRERARQLLGLPSDRTIVGFTGGMERRKRAAALLRCAARSPGLEHVVFALIGPFEIGLEEELLAEFGRLRERGRLILRNRPLGPQEVWAALGAFDGVVASYSERKRGLSAVAMLALRAGCPVVAAATPWMRSMARVTSAVHVVEDTGDPDELASVLQRAVHAPRPEPVTGDLLLLGGVESYRRAVCAAAGAGANDRATQAGPVADAVGEVWSLPRADQ